MSERQFHSPGGGARDVGGKPKRLDWRKTSKESVQFLFGVGRPNCWTIFTLLRLMESLQIHWRTDFRSFFVFRWNLATAKIFPCVFSVEKCSPC